MKEYQAVGFDQNRIPRVYGYGSTIEEAKRQCSIAVTEYTRPDVTIDLEFKINDTTPHFGTAKL